MPSLTFVMPHWLYWAGLLLFPLMALYLVRRQLRKPLPSRSLALHRVSVLADVGISRHPPLLSAQRVRGSSSFPSFSSSSIATPKCARCATTLRARSQRSSPRSTRRGSPSPTRRTRRRRPPPHLIAHRPTSRSSRPNTTRRRPSPITGCRGDATARSCWRSCCWSMRYCCRASSASVARWKKRRRIARPPSPKPHRSSPSPWSRRIRRCTSIRG